MNGSTEQEGFLKSGYKFVVTDFPTEYVLFAWLYCHSLKDTSWF